MTSSPDDVHNICMNFTIKPTFVAWSTLISLFPTQVFISIWAAGFLGSIFKVFFSDIGSHLGPHIFFGSCFFILTPLCVLILKKLNYDKTDYIFRADSLEFQEGFFTINKKIISYSDIKEINLRRGFLQRFNNLGTIYLATTATGIGTTNSFNLLSIFGFGNISASGLAIKDIKDPEQQYALIMSTINHDNPIVN